MEPSLVEARALGLGEVEGGEVLGDQVALGRSAVLDADGALEEVAEIDPRAAAADDLPVEEADLAVGQEVGVADVGVAVDEGGRARREGADVAGPEGRSRAARR